MAFEIPPLPAHTKKHFSSLFSLDERASAPVVCGKTKYGCCADRVTAAKGPNRKGCPGKVNAIKSTIFKMLLHQRSLKSNV